MLNSNHAHELEIIEKNIIEAIKKRNPKAITKQLNKVMRMYGIDTVIGMLRVNIKMTNNWGLNSSDIDFLMRHIRIERIDRIVFNEDFTQFFVDSTVIGGKGW